MPVLNIFALEDHIIPPPWSQALGKLVGTKDYTELALPGGHVGVFVSGKSQGVVGTKVLSWLEERSGATKKPALRKAANKAADKAAKKAADKPTAKVASKARA